MSTPTTREEFKEYCLRALGKGVIEINVSPEQVDDRVDEALKYYWDYHFDGQEKTYYKHLITQTDVTNGYITLPENIIGAVRIFEASTVSNTANMFNIRYQIALNDLYTLTNVSLVPYTMTMTHLRLLEQLLIGQRTIRYNRHMNRLYVDADWRERLAAGEYLLVEAFQIVDPEEFPNVWGDRWLFKYCTAKIKRQWGSNLKKFQGAKGPGGLVFDGQTLFTEADNEILALEKEMMYTYAIPASDMIG